MHWSVWNQARWLSMLAKSNLFFFTVAGHFNQSNFSLLWARWGLKQGRKKIMQFKVWGRRQPHDRSFKTVRDTEAEAVADTETEKVSRKGGCNDFGRKEHFHSNEKPLLGGAINLIWSGWQAKIQVKIREKRRSSESLNEKEKGW